MRNRETNHLSAKSASETRIYSKEKTKLNRKTQIENKEKYEEYREDTIRETLTGKVL